MRIFTVMNFLVALIPLFGIVLMQYVVIDVLWPPIDMRLEQRDTSRGLLLAMEMAFRAVLVAIACE